MLKIQSAVNTKATVVLETDTKRWMGWLEFVDSEHVTVHDGLRGRPPIVPIVDIDALCLAVDHPDVVTS